MPALANPKREAFARALATGKSQIEAHEAAGFKPHRGNASSLAQDKSILERVAELQAETAAMAQEATRMAAERLSIDREWVMARLQENALKAAANEDFSPSNQALQLLGKELGMFVDRKQFDIDGDLRGISDAQLLALFAASAADGDEEEAEATARH